MRGILAICLAIVSASTAYAADDAAAKVQRSRKMLSAFMCSTFADSAGLKADAQRLFELGLSEGRLFLSSLQNGEIPEDVVRKEAPFLGVLLLLSGPSHDFILGRIYENASRDSLSKISKSELEHVPLDEARKMNAENQYDSANCALIR